MINSNYLRRTPEQTILYDVLRNNFDQFRSDIASKRKSLPLYVEEEFKAFFDCGRLENGFVRLKCADCDHEKLLAFSCKRRGFCPSCCGRRMNESEIRICDEVFPRVPSRQWVLSLPMPLRFLCSRNRLMLNLLVQVFYSEITAFIQKKLRSRGFKNSKTGGILVIQRLGGDLNLNVHFHGIFLDGAYVFDEEDGGLKFVSISDSITSSDVAQVVERISAKSFKILEKEAFLVDGELTQPPDEDDAALLCDGASVKNLVAFGERAGKPVRRIRIQMLQSKAEIRGELVAEMNWFNLKADKSLKEHQRDKLRRLVRYITRPPLANERLSIADDGTVRYRMKRPWTDGTVEVQLSGVELCEKLAAAVPPPNGHLVRYFGILAPNAKLRRAVVLAPKPKARDESGKLRLEATQRASWAEIAKQAFAVDLTKCEQCGGIVRRIAVIRDPVVIEKILRHVGLCHSAQGESSRSRPPPFASVRYQQLEESSYAPI